MIAAGYGATVTAPIWGTQLAEQRDYGRYLKERARIGETAATTGAGAAADLYMELAAMAEKDAVLNDADVSRIINARKEIEKIAGRSYEALGHLAADYSENGLDAGLEVEFEKLLGNVIADLGEAIRNGAALDMAGDAARTAKDATADMAEEITAAAGDMAKRALTGAGPVGTMDAANAARRTLDEKVGEIAAAAKIAAQIDGAEAAEGLALGIEQGTADVIAAGDAAAAAAIKAIEDRLQINSPSRVTYDLGVYAAQGLARGIEAAAGAAIAAAASLAARVNAALSGAQLGSISDYGYSMGRAIYSTPSYGAGFASVGGASGGVANVTMYLDKEVIGHATAPIIDKTLGQAAHAIRG